MNKEELVKEIAKRATKEVGAEVSQKIATACLNAFTGAVETELLYKGEVALVGFGTFKTSARAERKGRNPQTQEEILIPATTAAVFKPGAKLKVAAVSKKPSRRKK